MEQFNPIVAVIKLVWQMHAMVNFLSGWSRKPGTVYFTIFVMDSVH